MVFVLIFYLKLNALYTSPLIDPNKVSTAGIVISSEALDKNNININSNLNISYNINKNYVYSNNNNDDGYKTNEPTPTESPTIDARQASAIKESSNYHQYVQSENDIDYRHKLPTDDNQIKFINNQEAFLAAKHEEVAANQQLDRFFYATIESNGTDRNPIEVSTLSEPSKSKELTESIIQTHYQKENQSYAKWPPASDPTDQRVAYLFNEIPQRLRISSEDGPDSENILGPSAYNDEEMERAFLKYENDNGKKCLLDDFKDALIWWTHSNGSLRSNLKPQSTTFNYVDLSSSNINEDDTLYISAKYQKLLKGPKIIAFSAANNNLTRAPFRTLTLMNGTLKYLTLRGNHFAAYSSEAQKDELGIAWATFPIMPALLELDISNCHIEYVAAEAFRNFTNLRRLYISHNKMLTIPFDTFFYIPRLQYLDLSFTNVLDFNYQIPLPTLEAVINLIYGVKIQQTTFRHLPELVYLDLSHTKLTRNSAVAFTHLGEKLKYLSLCYTAFPMIGNALFKNTALVALDLSGNPYASYNILDDTFEGVANTLRFLYFESSNIKEINWLKSLSSLRVLSLSQNNINSLTLDTYMPLKSLEILDLSSNHIGNWYQRVFTFNHKLRLLNLRDNNINIITSEMLKDFQFLQYLSLGDNNFVCDCLLRDLVEVAAANNKNQDCARDILQDAQDILDESLKRVSVFVTENISSNFSIEFNINKLMPRHIMTRYLPNLERSFNNLKANNYTKRKMQFLSRFYHKLRLEETGSCPEPESMLIHDKLNSSTLQFQLIDYEDEHYWCFNETERMHFVQLECQRRAIVDEIAKELRQLTSYVFGGVGGFIGIFLLAILIYFKRWHIQYYYTTLKSAALVSVATKDSIDKFNEIAEKDPNLIYDIFISYCHDDRQWVLEELLPNVEQSGDISICMHERDFQIGVTIVNNIISCMDRSRALMLIISANFLLSHWCQFEMYLAQHRIFDASKEHLIIVFLEDIPRRKRPKSLQYLMDVKTYIKWPADKNQKKVKAEEKKLFWKRLKRSLENIGLQSTESTA